MDKQQLLDEIKDTIVLSHRFHQQLRELLNSPHTDKKLLQIHIKNGTQ